MHLPPRWHCVAIVLSVSVGFAWTTAAQVTPDTLGVEEDVSAALEDLDPEGGDGEELAETLVDLAANPLDLNSAGAEDLAQIPALGPLLAQRIVAARTTDGPFGSLPEVQRVDGITPEVYAAARPYLTIGAALDLTAARPRRFPRPSTRTLLDDLTVDALQRVTRRLERGRGFTDTTVAAPYLGSPERLFTRLRVRSGRHLSLNLTLEKDPGEPFRWDPATATYGYDYLSAHAALQGFGRLHTLVLGDFVVNAGQGLTLWRSSAFGKGRDPVKPLLRTGRGLVPYRSTDENRFFRGVGATVLLTPRLTLTGFASRRTLDATALDPTLLSDSTTASFASFNTTGLHRRTSELARKDVVRETVGGGVVQYEGTHGGLGAVAYHSRFDDPLVPGSAAYERFRFQGTQATMASVYGHGRLGNTYGFGEVGRAPTGAWGGLGGLHLRLPRLADVLVLARHYPRDFVSLHGYAFGERTGATQNESGLYLGLRLYPARAWVLDAYVDQYRFPWARFGVARPSTGYDALLALTYTPRRWLELYLQARTETREEGTTSAPRAGRRFDALIPETRRSLRWQGTYQFSRALRLRTRAEVTRFSVPGHPAERGLLLFADVRWRPTRRVLFDARLTFFDVETFDARIYTYESDLVYAFSVPSFSGRGQRSYVLVRVSPTEAFDLEFKYATTRVEDVTTLGSGLDQVRGNRLRDVRAQVRWQF